MKKIRLGIIGAGGIVARVMKDMHRLENVEVTAIAARDLKRAQAVAEQYQIPHAYGSYLELAKSSEVDLAYIATPHNFHAEQAMMLMRHGKHVICEKPMALNPIQVQQMIDCARENGVFLMEAMWTRFLPVMAEIKKVITAGVIGDVLYMESQFITSDYDISNIDALVYNYCIHYSTVSNNELPPISGSLSSCTRCDTGWNIVVGTLSFSSKKLAP